MSDKVLDAADKSSHLGGRSHRMRNVMTAFAALTALVIAARPAVAQDEKGKDKDKARGAITLTEVTITGRIEKPIAAVDVARIQPRLTLAELRQPFLERIEQVIYKSPF